jgi:hypothetical protein
VIPSLLRVLKHEHVFAATGLNKVFDVRTAAVTG